MALGAKIAPVVDAELPHRTVEVCLHGSFREHETIGHLCIGQSASSELDHLCLAWRELDRGVVETFYLRLSGALVGGLQLAAVRDSTACAVLASFGGEGRGGMRGCLGGVTGRAEGGERFGGLQHAGGVALGSRGRVLGVGGGERCVTSLAQPAQRWRKLASRPAG